MTDRQLDNDPFFAQRRGEEEENHYHPLVRSILEIQRWTRGHLCRTRLRKSRDGITFSIVLDLLERYKNQYQYISELNRMLKRRKIRFSNFPPELSENMIKFIFFQKYGIMPSWDTDTGDLQCRNLILEVKAFSSTGPTTFGPNEKWDRIYFLDATRFMESIFKVYECKLKNTSSLWQQLEVNKTETFGDQCRQGRRPRIGFQQVYRQLRSHCHLIFEGQLSIETLQQK